MNVIYITLLYTGRPLRNTWTAAFFGCWYFIVGREGGPTFQPQTQEQTIASSFFKFRTEFEQLIGNFNSRAFSFICQCTWDPSGSKASLNSRSKIRKPLGGEVSTSPLHGELVAYIGFHNIMNFVEEIFGL